LKFTALGWVWMKKSNIRGKNQHEIKSPHKHQGMLVLTIPFSFH